MLAVAALFSAVVLLPQLVPGDSSLRAGAAGGHIRAHASPPPPQCTACAGAAEEQNRTHASPPPPQCTACAGAAEEQHRAHASPPPPPPPPPCTACTDVLSGRWVARVGEAVVPLVPWGVVAPTNLSLAGFHYPGLENAQGEQFQAPGTLAWAWEPDGCAWAAPALNVSGVDALLRGRWLHLDGDSVGRDVFFDIAEAVRQGEGAAAVAREKAHADLDVETAEGAHITLGWNPADRPICEAETTWARQPPRPQGPDAPDIWVYGVSLWELAKRPGEERTVADFRRRIECELDLKPPRTLGIFRGATPYSAWVGSADVCEAGAAACAEVQARHGNFTNPRLYNFTISAREAIAGWNARAAPGVTRWHVVDPWEMLFPRRDEVGFRRDGIHYTGVGSRTVTHAVLQVVAACAAAEGTACGC